MKRSEGVGAGHGTDSLYCTGIHPYPFHAAAVRYCMLRHDGFALQTGNHSDCAHRYSRASFLSNSVYRFSIVSPDAGLHVAEPHGQHRKARLVRGVSASQWNSSRSFPAAPRLSPHHRFDAGNRLSRDCTLDPERVNRRPSFQTERASMDDRAAAKQASKSCDFCGQPSGYCDGRHRNGRP